MNQSAIAVAADRERTSMIRSAVALMLTSCSSEATIRSAQTMTATTVAIRPTADRWRVATPSGPRSDSVLWFEVCHTGAST